MPKISVIVPCYNVAPYVGTCLDSLVNQTLRDIEIICADDKSTDNTAEIVGGNPAKVFMYRDKEHFYKLKEQGKFH